MMIKKSSHFVNIILIVEQLPAIRRAAVGGNVTLDCNAESYPSPTFHWEKGNGQGHYMTLSGETSEYLQFTSVTTDFSGEYCCVVNTLSNTITSNVTTIYGMSIMHVKILSSLSMSDLHTVLIP